MRRSLAAPVFPTSLAGTVPTKSQDATYGRSAGGPASSRRKRRAVDPLTATQQQPQLISLRSSERRRGRNNVRDVGKQVRLGRGSTRSSFADDGVAVSPGGVLRQARVFFE